MNWSSILSVAKQLGTGVLLIGVIATLIFGTVEQTKERMAEYKKDWPLCGLAQDFLEMVNRSQQFQTDPPAPKPET